MGIAPTRRSHSHAHLGRYLAVLGGDDAVVVQPSLELGSYARLQWSDLSSRVQAPNCVQPVFSRRVQQRAGSVHCGLDRERNPEIRSVGPQGVTEKFGGRDSDYGYWLTVHRKRLTDYVSIGRVMLLPSPVAHHGHRWRA